MRIVADESVDQQIVERLRADGHGVVAIAETSPAASDDLVLEMAASSDSVLVTADTDFGELVFRLGKATRGVVLLRLHGMQAAFKANLVSAALSSHEPEIEGNFVVIAPGHVRIRLSP